MIKKISLNFELSSERRIFLLVFSLFITITTVFFSVYKLTSKVQAGWWNDTWQYRKSISVTSGSDAVTNYQVLIDNYNTATDITAKKMQTDCGDIRFTSQAGVELPYWIESGCNTSTTDIWVKIDSIPVSGGIDIYMYYGNPSAENGTDITATFEFGDDFESGNIDKWTYEISGSENDSGATRQVTDTQAYSGNYSAETYYNAADGDAYLAKAIATKPIITEAWYYDDTDVDINNIFGYSGGYVGIEPATSATYYSYRCSWGSWATTTKLRSTGWHKFKLSYNGSTTTIYIDGTSYGTCSSTYTSIVWYGTIWGSTAGHYLDNVFVRQYLATEPTTTVNSEEQGNGPIAYYSFDENYGTTVHNQLEKDGETGLIGWWKFNDASSGTTPAPQDSMEVNDGTWNGDASYTSTAKIGSAATFDGTGDYVEAPIPWTISSEIQASGITYSAWIKTSTTATAGSIAGIGKDGGCSHYCLTGLQINLEGTGIASMVMYNGTSYKYANSDSSVADGAWHHLVGIYRTNGYLELYVDGILQDRINAGSLYYRYTYDKVAIGANIDENPNAEFFTGQIDEVRVYNRALDSGEVSGLYSLTHGQMINMDPTTDWVEGAKQNPQQRPLGKALDFDGTNDYVDLTTGFPKFSYNSPFSISAWFNATSTSGTRGIFIQQGSTNKFSYGLRISSGSLQFIVCKNSVGCNSISQAVSVNVWYHATGTFDGTDLYLYLDGKYINTTSYTYGTISDPDSFATIGSDSDDYTGRAFSGKIDEIKIYKKVLSADQIKTEYNRSAGIVMGAGIHAGTGAAPMAYWKLDEGSARTAFDSSGNNYVATMSATMNEADWVVGKVGGAIEFDGSDDTLFVDYESDFDFDRTQALTIAAWIKTSATGNKAIFSKLANSGDYQGYEFNVTTDGYIRFLEINQATTNRMEVEGNIFVQDGAWHHVAVTYDGTSSVNGIKLYVDGTLDTNTTNYNTLSASILNNFLPYIGSRNKVGSWFNGSIDHLKIYTYVRTPEQIHYDMATGSPVGYYSFDEGFGTTVSNNQEKVISDNLVGWWKMDEGADNLCTGGSNDICDSMKVNDGTNSSATWATGRPGGALTTNGSSTYFQIPDHDSTDFAYNQDFTVAFWVKDGGGNANQDAIVEKWAASGGYPFVFRYDTTNSVRFYRYDGTNNPTSLGTTTINDSAWHQIVGVKKGSTMYLYIDGSLEDSDTDTTTGTTTNSSPIYVGMRGGGSNYYAGTVDDLRIYNTGLTASEVSALYTSTKGALINMDPNSDWVEGASQNPQQRPLGKALDFDGTNDRIHIPYTSRFNLSGRSPYTISAWVKPHASGNYYVIASQADSTQNAFVLAIDTNSKLVLGRHTEVTGSSTIPTNLWTHVTGVYDGSYLYVYINGQSDATPVSEAIDRTSLQDIIIGAFTYDSPSLFFDGLIDEVKIYNYALTSEEIKTEYNRGAALVLGGGKSESDPINNLVGWWKLDESTGYTAFDSSGKNNTGILTNGPTWSVGKNGRAVYFDGSDDNIVINNETNFDFERTDKFSIAAWINLSSSFGANLGSSIFTKSYATRGYEFWISPNAQNVVVELYNTFSSNHLKVSSTNTHAIKFNTWHHVAFSYDGSSSPSGIAIYIDGLKQATTTEVNTLTATILNDYSPKIGTWDSFFGYFSGSIDNVKVWNSQLSAAEIAWEYNQGAPVYHWDFNEGQGLITANSQGKSVSTDNLVGFWTMDSTTVNDISGNDNHLTNSSSPTSVTGIKGNAVDYLASSTQYSYCTDANCGADLDYQKNGLTVSAWVKADSDPGANMTIVSKDYWTSSTDNGGYVLYWADGTSQYIFTARSSSGNANYCVAESGVNISTSYWHHVTGVYDGASCKIYINSVLKDTESYSNGIKNVTQDFTIGRHDGGSYWDGKIDHVKVWQRALSAEEISIEYGYNEKYGYLTNMDASTDWVDGAWPNPNRPKLGKALDFDGSNDYVTISDSIIAVQSLSFWIKPTSTTQSIIDLDGGTHYLSLSSGSIIADGFSSPSYYVNGKAGQTIVANAWNHVVITTSTSFTASAITPGKVSTNYYSGQIDELKIYNYPLTSDQVKLDYNNSAAVRF